jgi:hypothetical protein
MTVCAGAYRVPVMSSNPFGTMFQVTGTAATQNSRVAARAGGAADIAAAPITRRVISATRRLTGP